MRIVVTGATSFVGRHVIDRLAGHEVIALGRRRPPATSGNTTAGPVAVDWIEADLSRGLDPARLPANADALIHLAQSDRYRDFPAGAEDVFRVNVAAPLALMRWARGAGVGRAVFASTGTVYEPFTGPMHEAAAVAPTGFYGASKLACETLTLPWMSDELAVAHLRLFFIYGPGQGNSMLSRVMANVVAGNPVTLPADGDGLVFAATYVSDVADAFARAVDESWRGVWNVAGPEAPSLKRYIDAVAAASGRPPVINRTAGQPHRPVVPDLAKLASRMDCARFVSLEQGIRRTLAQA